MSDKSVDRLKDALHIDREPFSEEGMAGLFYPGGGRQSLLDQLTHLARYGSPLLVLTGENGVGKSTLLSQLMSSLDPAVYKPIYIDADILADEHFVLSRIAEGYSLDLGSDSKTAVNALVRYAKELDSYSQTPLLVIDNGQNLSSEAVDLIQLILSHAGSSGLRFLVAFDGDRAADVPLLANLVASGFDYQEIIVPSLDKVACEEYLSYRMTTSGLGSIQFNRDQIEQIYNHSQGNPDKANIIARQLLVESFPYKKNQRKPIKFPMIPLFGALALVALLVSTYWLDDSPEGPIAEEVIGPPKVEAAESSDDVKPAELIAEETDEEVPVDLDSDDVEMQLDSFSSVAGEVDYNYEDSESQELFAPVEEVKEEVMSPVKSASPEEQKKIVESVGAKEQSITKKVEVKPVEEPFTQREKWLLSLDRSKYTLQMLGANEKSTVHKYLARYPSLKELAYYKTTRKAQDWYVVVYGQYPSKESAKQQLGSLPKSIRDSKPWPRTLASVQDDIRSAKK